MPDDELNEAEFSAAGANGCNGIVLVHDGPDCDDRAARMLSWYDAGAHVAPHEERCACVDATGRPDPACPRCHGKGRWLAMGNPEAKFTSAYRLAVWRHWGVRVLAEFAAAQCAAIVTPDGEWHGRDECRPDEWDDEALFLLSDHAHFAALGFRFSLVTPS